MKSHNEITEVDMPKNRGQSEKDFSKQTSNPGRPSYSARYMVKEGLVVEDQIGKDPFILTANLRGSGPLRSPGQRAVSRSDPGAIKPATPFAERRQKDSKMSRQERKAFL
jgi:hypothetical protein